MPITVDDIKAFHLDCDNSVVLLETLEVSHSLWDAPIRTVSNHADGFYAPIETSETVFFEFGHVSIQRGKSSDDLDQSLSITIGDLGEVLPPLIALIRDANSDEKPSVTYRTYAYDSLAMELSKDTPLDTVTGLFVNTMSRSHEACTFEAKNDDKNTVKTGTTMNMVDNPDLKGLI